MRRSRPLRTAPFPGSRDVRSLAERVQFVREANGYRYFIDTKYPERGEFFLMNTLETPAQLGYTGQEVERWYPSDPQYPDLGPYYVDDSGRHIFADSQGYFYPTVWENGQHVRVRVSPRMSVSVRSRAGGGSATSTRDGAYSRGSTPSDSR